jgi:hypothetical protein
VRRRGGSIAAEPAVAPDLRRIQGEFVSSVQGVRLRRSVETVRKAEAQPRAPSTVKEMRPEYRFDYAQARPKIPEEENYIMLDHGNGKYSYHSHLDQDGVFVAVATPWRKGR